MATKPRARLLRVKAFYLLECVGGSPCDLFDVALFDSCLRSPVVDVTLWALTPSAFLATNFLSILCIF